MDWTGWLDRVEAIERQHPSKRIVSVSIPGGLPKVGWNVENHLYRGRVPVDSNRIENMRAGVYGSFRVTDGAFAVLFNDGIEVSAP